MIYRDLGHTGYRVSRLGFGAMRLPMTGEPDKWKDDFGGSPPGTTSRVDRKKAIPMLIRAFKAGVNYVDTAVNYCNQDSQRVLGKALQGYRSQIVVSTKNHEYEDEKIWWGHLEDSLARLRVEYIDLYSHHGLTWDRYVEQVEPRTSHWMRSAKDQGLIHHICTSFHDTNDSLRKIIDTGYVDVVTVQYNILDRQLEDGIAYAHEKGIGVVVMGPVAGGRLGCSSSVLESLVPGISRVPELALRFVFCNPHVSLVLSGMGTMQMVRENTAIALDRATLSALDKAAIDEQLERLGNMADLYCTGCGYCMPCSLGVNIPHIFQQYNEARVYGLWEQARAIYQEWPWWVTGARADSCVACGECIAKCPQHVQIPEQLARVHSALQLQED